MSTAFLEQLQSRLMFHNTGPLKPTEPSDDEPGAVVIRQTLKGDPDLGATVNFADLVSLARNYNTTNTQWSGGYDYDGSVNFADLVLLAQNYNQAGSLMYGGAFGADWSFPQVLAISPATASADLNAKGKLVVSMGDFNNAFVGVTKTGATKVFFNRVSRHGLAQSTNVFSKTFRGVRSIEVRGSAAADSITLGNGIRFTTVHAGNGSDTIRGGDGDSALFGADGYDRIYGGGGDDSLHGEEGNDHLFGEGGDDLLDGATGKDRLDGGKGRNQLLGRSGADYLSVRFGRDKFDREGKDRVYKIE